MNARPGGICIGILAVALLCPNHATAQEAAPGDLALVPGDALGFAHVRVAEIWKSEPFKYWRQTIEAAGEDALRTFEQRFVPAPSSIERVTGFLLAPPPGQNDPAFALILATSQKIDQGAFLEHMVKNVRKQEVNGKTFYVQAGTQLGYAFPSDRLLVFGNLSAIQAMLERPAAPRGPLAEAVKLARSKPLVLAVNAAALPAQVMQQVPPPFQPLVRAELATLSIDLAAKGRVDVRLHYANADRAEAADKAARMALKMGLGFVQEGRHQVMKMIRGDGRPGPIEDLPEAAAGLMAAGFLNQLEQLLLNPPLRRQGDTLHLAIEFPMAGPEVLSAGAIGAALLLPAIQKTREAAARMQDMNNLKQIALALHNYHEVHRGLPSAAICDPNGKPLLSWRVAILPFLDQNALYRQFKLDEPWDSEHNRKLIPLMPQLYKIPISTAPQGETHYRVFVGNGTLFEMDQKTNFRDVRDGLSNTVMVVESAETVPWTKPEPLEYDPQKPLPKLFRLYSGQITNIALADGSVRALAPTIDEAVLRALITRAGNEIVNLD